MICFRCGLEEATEDYTSKRGQPVMICINCKKKTEDEAKKQQ